MVAQTQVGELIEKHSVIGILGPMFSKTSRVAALRADDWGVPLVSLSFAEEIPRLGEYVFQAALTVRSQAESLVSVAFDQLGMKKFAILYPQNTYGRGFLNAFWDEVDRRKGLVTAVEVYSPEATNFQAPARKLVGRHWLWARGDYRAAVKDLQAQRLPSHVFRSRVEDLRKTLPPITDFDAIIIPDTGQTLGLLTPALAVEDIVTETDPKQLERIRKALGVNELQPVTLMGGSTWNKASHLKRCGRYCENSVFVDSFFLDDTHPRARDFVTAFSAATRSSPFRSDAEAFDAASMLKQAIRTSSAQNRTQLLSGLRELAGFAGVTGELSFDEQGACQRNLRVLTFKEEAIILWTKPEAPNAG